MNDENMIWINLIRCVAASFIAFIAIGGGCTMHTDYRISMDVAHGADPIASACAHALTSDKSVCAIAAAKVPK